MDGNPNEILKDDISLSQNNRLPDTTDSPNEEISMDNDADGDNSITARSNEEVPENMISDITGDPLSLSNLIDSKTEKDSRNIPSVTAQTKTEQDVYSFDDIYRSLEESREIQAETRKTLEHGNRLLKISNSIGISIIFAIALALGALIGRVVWRMI